MSSTAFAGCVTTDYNFLFSNDTVKAESSVDAGGCTYEFEATGDAAFSQASVVAKPQHGALKQTRSFNFEYTPSKGYAGVDKYSIKICEKAGGCSTIVYTATVK